RRSPPCRDRLRLRAGRHAPPDLRRERRPALHRGDEPAAAPERRRARRVRRHHRSRHRARPPALCERSHHRRRLPLPRRRLREATRGLRARHALPPVRPRRPQPRRVRPVRRGRPRHAARRRAQPLPRPLNRPPPSPAFRPNLVMTRFLPLLLLGALLMPYATPASAQSTYNVAWPEGDPIWEMTVVRPSQSSGSDGSGLEIRDVYYNGHLVMKRGHVPILNVKYEAGCNCFRDWQDAEGRFVANNPLPSPNNWVAEATPGTVQTMCDAAPDNCSGNTCNDVGSHNGVAVERFDDRLVLTTHLSAGWYRYTMRWTFHEDGTIRPRFGFTSTGTACTTNPRRHHAFWRLDFDIDGAENDYVLERRTGEDDLVFEQEASRIWQLFDVDP